MLCITGSVYNSIMHWCIQPVYSMKVKHMYNNYIHIIVHNCITSHFQCDMCHMSCMCIDVSEYSEDNFCPLSLAFSHAQITCGHRPGHRPQHPRPYMAGLEASSAVRPRPPL